MGKKWGFCKKKSNGKKDWASYKQAKAKFSVSTKINDCKICVTYMTYICTLYNVHDTQTNFYKNLVKSFYYAHTGPKYDSHLAGIF